METEKAVVESHKKLLCLDDDLDLLYSLLNETKHILTKGKAKEINKYTINLDTNLRKSIALSRSRLINNRFEKPNYSRGTDDVFEENVRESTNRFTYNDLENNQVSNSKAILIRIDKQEKEIPSAGEAIKRYSKGLGRQRIATVPINGHKTKS